MADCQPGVLSYLPMVLWFLGAALCFCLILIAQSPSDPFSLLTWPHNIHWVLGHGRISGEYTRNWRFVQSIGHWWIWSGSGDTMSRDARIWRSTKLEISCRAPQMIYPATKNASLRWALFPLSIQLKGPVTWHMPSLVPKGRVASEACRLSSHLVWAPILGFDLLWSHPTPFMVCLR